MTARGPEAPTRARLTRAVVVPLILRGKETLPCGGCDRTIADGETAFIEARIAVTDPPTAVLGHSGVVRCGDCTSAKILKSAR